ncbi:MAG: branched chain amino acid aminotransferase [Bacteroidetes bacterium GWE2_41_25]|nr:MAG: branched chain amino acid aminotransferase [Bacteroidetes bacterium GWC2_40_22]OFY12075.1 MAG: branched chain amino acid aminotransferase [Bacteroidetes bacterium GWE2_41_25]OFY58125.1 MAG: branched chain amino acid aminotransferase [Bacteroidetes bacterium GWF2_41_9]HAM11320.1 branched chain amino acid aminotransferase [Bacteroidales bacterium]HBH83894.1 branched chain amino acid aminotransferase [Bacteroidales bacterium]
METLDWKNLPFGYLKTDYNVRCVHKDGKWGKLEVSASEYIDIHIAATGLHYGQEAFEGMKAYMGKDGKIRLFRWEENAKRFCSSADGVKMAVVPVEMFREAIFKVINLNRKFIPPYGSGATLYIRPLLFGSGAEVGVKPASEYTFLVFVTPVGPYFKEGIKPVNMLICRDFDRAAPLGTGIYKVGGNYAASMRAITAARNGGYSNTIFLDAKEKKYIDECGPANFFGIKDNTYITPKSESILNSITNMSLIDIARSFGMKAERRPIAVEELAEFTETGACGTAAVITPIAKIVDPDMNMIYEYCRDGKPGPLSMKLYERLMAIQCGDAEDEFGWITIVE